MGYKSYLNVLLLDVKIPRQRWRAGSSPAFGTRKINAPLPKSPFENTLGKPYLLFSVADI